MSFHKGISWFKKQDKITQWTLLVVALGIVLRFAVTFFVHAAGDSFSHLSTARFIAQNHALPLFEPIYRPFFYYPPLFHILTAGLYSLFSVFGESVATKAMDFIAPLYGSAILIVSYLLYDKLKIPKKVKLYSLVFLSFVPIHFYYSTLAHVDIGAAFMALISVYLLQTKKFYWAAVLNGFGMLTKYTHLFIFPTLVYQLKQQYSKTSVWIKRSVLFFAISFVIGIPLYIRNLIYLGTPMWPFMNNLFALFGMTPYRYVAEDWPVASLTHFANAKLPIIAYLDFFGVPLGLPENLMSLPVHPTFIVGWLIMTVLFLIPLIFGFFAKKPKKIMPLLWIWILSYVIMLVYYVYDFGEVFMRLILSMFPALAIIWGYGFVDILKRAKKVNYRKGIVVLLVLLCVGFTGVEFVKANVAAAGYDKYQTDYDWIRQNIDQARFDKHSTYLLYHTNTQMVSKLCTLEDYDQNTIYHYSDPLVEPNGPDPKYNDWEVVYENPKTRVKIFKKT